MGVPESVFSLGPWDESGNPFTMSTVRRNHEHSAPLSPRHAGPQRRTAAERADRAFTFHRGRSDAPTRHDATPGSRGCAPGCGLRARSDGPTARPTGSDRRIREPLRGGSATLSPITNVLQSPSQKVDGSAVDRSLYYETARSGAPAIPIASRETRLEVPHGRKGRTWSRSGSCSNLPLR